MSKDHIDRHHERPREKVFPDNETFSLPHCIEYIDVVRETHTNIENILENGINDIWIESKDVHLSEDYEIPDLANKTP